jgi:uncharacterized protein YndB with AHSA1/START domain
MTYDGETREIVAEDVLPHALAAVWKVLTTCRLITRWLMPNDFEPVVGRKFNFRRAPMGDWNGVVDCEVLEVVPESRLVYSWRGGFGTPGELDTIVTWTLTSVEAGTRLRMVHAGFRLPRNAIAYQAMSPGWGSVMQGVARMVAEEDDASQDRAQAS